MTVAWWPGARAPRGGQGPLGPGSVSSGAMGPPLCWRPWAVGPRVPRRPTSGLGRRLLGGSCAPSRRPAALFPRGCSGFRRLRPLPPSCCLAASPRLPCRPGAAPRCAGAPPARCGLLSVSAAAAGPAVVSCADGGRLLPPYAVRPPPRSGARARAWVGSRLSAVAVAAARCLRRRWGMSGSGPASPCSAGARAGPPRPRRGRPEPRPRPRAATGGRPGVLAGSDRPSPLRAATGVPSSVVAGPGQSASLAVAGGVGPWRVGERLPAPPPAGPCAPCGWLPPPPPPPPRVPPRARHVRPTGRPCARAPPGGRGLSLAHRAPTWLILPVAYACLKD